MYTYILLAWLVGHPVTEAKAMMIADRETCMDAKRKVEQVEHTLHWACVPVVGAIGNPPKDDQEDDE